VTASVVLAPATYRVVNPQSQYYQSSYSLVSS